MTTIFRDIVVFFVVHELRDEQSRAEAKNKSAFSIRRNTEFSQYKIDQAEKLKSEVLNLPGDKKDKQLLEDIRELVLNYKTTVAAECKRNKLGEGKFGEALTKVISDVDVIYLTLKEKKLLDIHLEIDSQVEPNYHLLTSERYVDPLHRFYYYAAFYFCHKAVNPNNSWFTGLLDFLLWNSVEVSEEKDDILLRSLHSCQNALDELDTKKERYAIARANRVLDFVQGVLRGNVAVCVNHAALKDGVPLVTGTLANVNITPTLKPTRGFLKYYMERAETEIERLKTKLELELRTREQTSNTHKPPGHDANQSLSQEKQVTDEQEKDAAALNAESKKTAKTSVHSNLSLLKAPKVNKKHDEDESLVLTPTHQ
ncbi:hypothetical protein [Legionella jordanis]|uniref:Coiled-coil protein n=1 Tax=Legionella jordanis TaxID=456 RepID=A0A0W0VD55_9GAMM|nr:hypothetical protein [Legionella jordanis]KTD17805.1 coiled-coil protein [Legionella jordanis]RMX02492.1 hypothetical protein EAW55_09610 [Legionella jordanis]RMX21665.1 hypothetical protein EAS68_02610 [Legionella jordanis]VEH11258.1 coiled-coil protein [Legionella jordanis]HAT8713774.1 hypothetical protein [Legionella jordanis]